MLARLVGLALVAWLVALPLRDVLAYPERVSVLGNLQTDAEAYYTLARNLAASGDLDALPPRHPPGWIATLALAFSVAGASYVAGKVVLWLSLLACAAGAAWLARRMYGELAAWIAALLCASSAAMRGYVGTVQYEVFTGALLAGLLVLAVRAVEAPTPPRPLRRAAATAALGGALILTRETFAVVLPLVALWMAGRLKQRYGTRRAAVTAALVTCVSLAPPVAWTIFQSLRVGQLITISEKGPIVIELGHNPLANGTYNAPLVGIGEPTGLAFALRHPGREVVLSLRKVLYFWGVLRDGWNVPRPMAVWMWRASTGLLPIDVLGAIARGGWLLALFIVAIRLLGPGGRARWWIVPGVVLVLMAVHIVTLSSHRFAVPTLPLTFALVSGPLARLVAWSRSRLASPVVWAPLLVFAVLVIVMQFQRWPLSMQLEAAALDGLSADNRHDEVSGRLARVADAGRGTRPVVLLADEYFARGVVRVGARIRRASDAPSGSLPALQMSMVALDGTLICATEAAAGALPADRFEPLAMQCTLPRDTVATFAIVSRGAVDLVVDEVAVEWLGQ